jgi:hypothetical protein
MLDRIVNKKHMVCTCVDPRGVTVGVTMVTGIPFHDGE